MAVKMLAYLKLGGAGWSEIYYNSASITGGDLQGLADGFVANRQLLLAKNVNLTNVKFSDLNDARRTKIFRYVASSVFATVTSSTQDADIPFLRVLVKMQCANAASRNLWLGGFEDDLTQAQNPFITDADWVRRFGSFKAYILNSGFVGYTLIGAGNTKKLIDNITIVNQRIRLTVTAHGIADGAQVRVSRLVSSPDINGLYRVKAVDANTLELLRSDTALTAIPFEAGGTVSGQLKVTSNVTDVQQVKWSRHGVGGPFGKPRGRRSKKRPKVPLILTA